MTPDEARVLALGKYPEADDFQFLPSDPCAVCGGVLGITYAHGMHAECTSELWLGSRDRGIDRARQFLSTECGVAPSPLNLWGAAWTKHQLGLHPTIEGINKALKDRRQILASRNPARADAMAATNAQRDAYTRALLGRGGHLRNAGVISPPRNTPFCPLTPHEIQAGGAIIVPKVSRVGNYYEMVYRPDGSRVSTRFILGMGDTLELHTAVYGPVGSGEVCAIDFDDPQVAVNAPAAYGFEKEELEAARYSALDPMDELSRADHIRLQLLAAEKEGPMTTTPPEKEETMPTPAPSTLSVARANFKKAAINAPLITMNQELAGLVITMGKDKFPWLDTPKARAALENVTPLMLHEMAVTFPNLFPKNSAPRFAALAALASEHAMTDAMQLVLAEFMPMVKAFIAVAATALEALPDEVKEELDAQKPAAALEAPAENTKRGAAAAAAAAVATAKAL